MAGLGAKGDHCAGRKENAGLNGLQVQHATFLSQHKSFFLTMLLGEPSSGRQGGCA